MSAAVGSVPAVLGAVRFGLVTIGITNDESKANVLMVRGDKYDAVKKDPASIKGQKILLTSNSTGDYAVQACLKKWGVAKADVQLVNLGQAQIISAITSNNGDFAGVWAPNNYTLAEKGGAKLLCSGYDAGAIVPGALISRPDFAKEKPELVAKYLAVYLRAWAWIKANPKEAREMMKKFYAQGGVEISDQGMESEFADRPVFSLDEQIKNMDRSAGKSKVDTWLGNIGEFMKSVGHDPRGPRRQVVHRRHVHEESRRRSRAQGDGDQRRTEYRTASVSRSALSAPVPITSCRPRSGEIHRRAVRTQVPEAAHLAAHEPTGERADGRGYSTHIPA